MFYKVLFICFHYRSKGLCTEDWN